MVPGLRVLARTKSLYRAEDPLIFARKRHRNGATGRPSPSVEGCQLCKLRSCRCPMARPVYLQQQTYLVTAGTAVEPAQIRTHAPQQTASLFDHLLGAHQYCFGNGKSEGLRSLEVHDQ